MALTYHFDLYPRTNPNGARLVRFTNLQAAEYRGEANGTGAGRFTIRATDAEAAFIDPEGLQYVRVVRDDGATELVVGGFFLDSGDYAALTETSTKLLTWGGAGTLSYLGRAVMDADSWIDDPFIGTDPQPDGTWPLHLAGTGNELGAILWRVLHELEEPGRHQDPVPLMTLGFTHLVDSNAASWVVTTGDFVAQVTDGILSIIRRLMQLGLYVEVDPDDFEVRAYEPETHRRDRTGGAWATDVVRFQSPTDGTVATGNIKSDAKRALEAKVRRNALLTGSNDSWLWVDDPGVTVPWEGGYLLDDEDGTSLLKAGEAQLSARSDAGDVLRLRMKLGDDEANGAYLPFEHVLLDDLVTVHTGTGQWDYNEAEFPVAALTIALRPGGDWDAWADLGSTYLSMAERSFQAQSVGHHTHPPNPQLCRIGTSGTPIINDEGVNTTSGSDAIAWDGGSGTGNKDLTIDAGDTNRALYVFVLHRHDDGTPTPVWRRAGPIDEALTLIAGPQGNAGATGTINLYRLLAPTAGVGQVLVSNAASTRTGGFYVTGVHQTTPEASTDTNANDGVTASGVTVSGGALYLDAAGMVNAGEVSVANPTPSGAQTQAWSVSVDTGADDSEFGGSSGDPTPTWTSASSRNWVAAAVAINGVGTIGDGHADLVGDDPRASRCDHAHHVLRATDPTVTDDEDAGYKVTTLWTNTVSGESFLLTDATGGAAVWDPFGGGADLSGINFLVGTASGDLSAEIVVGATPGGELGNTWASPTVDATHSGSTHSAATDTHIADATDAHDASAVSFDDTGLTITAANAQEMGEELDAAISAGGIPATIFDAAGDIIVASAADTAVRLAAGSEDDVLTIVSGVPAWAAPTGGTGAAVPDLLNSTKGSADTPDAEFTGTISPFTAVDGSSGTVTLLAATGAGLYDVATRDGWLLMQLGTASGDGVQLKQDYTLPDGNCLVAPISFAADQAAALANNEMQVGIGVNNDDTAFNAGTHTEIMVDIETGGARILVNGDAGAVSQLFTAQQVEHQTLHFFRVDRAGLVYHFFWSLDGFSWSYLGSRTLGAAANNVWLFGACGATMANRIVVGVPWFRQGTGLAADPWPL